MRITLCGSTRFKDEFNRINALLSLRGHVVYSVAIHGHADGVPLTPEQKATLDSVHKLKIDNSDCIVVIDVGGYIGESTQSEIAYAHAKSKLVIMLSQYPDLEILETRATSF